jgi:TnpA family transposase
MPRRRVLTDAQREALLALPTRETDLIRHWTLGTADLAVVERRRGHHNRLGFALQLCAFRFPDRAYVPVHRFETPILAYAAMSTGPIWSARTWAGVR